MKTWKKRIKLKPQGPFRVMGIVPRNAKERHEEELSESIYRKRVYWPDRLIPLTEEEKEYEAKSTLTLGWMNQRLDEIHVETE